MTSLPPELWAKSPRRGGDPPETLEGHTLAVVERVAEWRERLGLFESLAVAVPIWDVVARAAIIHDTGKAADRFQAMLRNGESWGRRHEVLSLAFTPSVVGVTEPAWPWICAAVASHHRDWSLIGKQTLESLDDQEEELDWSRRFVSELPAGVDQSIWEWASTTGLAKAGELGLTTRPGDPPPFPGREELAQLLLAGLKAYRALTRDAQNSRETWPTRGSGILVRGLLVLADRLASSRGRRLAHVRTVDLEDIERRLQKQRNDPDLRLDRHHQVATAKAGRRVLLEAPTGSGKTEAALGWAGSRARQGGSGRILYVLPYQASINAMRTRLKRLRDLGAVGILHGRANQVLFRELSESARSEQRADYWAKRTLDHYRLFGPAHLVTTPYQLLKSAFRLSGYEAALTATLGASLIVDEIHAYEPVRLGQITALLSWLADEWRAEILVMTATLPSWSRDLLSSELAPERVRAADELYDRTRRHRLHVLDIRIDHPEMVRRVGETARDGKSVLVAVNSVRTAQEVRAAFACEFGDVDTLLLHSRFSARDRLERERELAERLTSARKRRGFIAVATQVVEVSLDVDFDTTYSEIAPLEALLQRFGRVNRTGAKGLVDVHVCADLTDSSTHVYAADLVRRSRSVLETVSGKVFDEASAAGLIDQQYSQDLASRFFDEAASGAKQFKSACLDRLYAFESDPDLENAFDELFDGAEVLPEALLSAYLTAFDRSSINASSLLVPISWRQLQGLKRAGLIERSAEPRGQRFRPWVARVPYDGRGLHIDLAGVTDTA